MTLSSSHQQIAVIELLPADQDARYREAARLFGPALGRLAHAYERNPEKQKDLVQDIHFALWRSFASFDTRCSVRTWVYRVAHNVATSHVLRDKRRLVSAEVGLEALEREAAGRMDGEAPLVERLDAERQRTQLTALIQRLSPLDREIVLLYLEDLDAATIGEVTGLSAPNIATKIHRIKRILARAIQTTGGHET